MLFQVSWTGAGHTIFRYDGLHPYGASKSFHAPEIY